MVTSYVMEPAEQMCNCFKRQAQGTAWSMVSYSEESGFLESGRLDNSYWLRHHQLVWAGRAVQLVWEGPAVWRKYASSPEKGDLHHPAWKISCSFCIIIKKKKHSALCLGVRTYVVVNSFLTTFPQRIPHASVPQAVLVLADWRNCEPSFRVPQCGRITGTFSMLPSTPVFKDLAVTAGPAGLRVVLSTKGHVMTEMLQGTHCSKPGSSLSVIRLGQRPPSKICAQFWVIPFYVLAWIVSKARASPALVAVISVVISCYFFTHNKFVPDKFLLFHIFFSQCSYSSHSSFQRVYIQIFSLEKCNFLTFLFLEKTADLQYWCLVSFSRKNMIFSL